MLDNNELAIILTARLDQLDAGLKDATEKLNGFSKQSEKSSEGGTVNFLKMAAAVYEVVKEMEHLVEQTVIVAAKTEALNAALSVVATNMHLNIKEIHDQEEAIQNLGYTGEEAADLMLKFAKAHIDTKEAVDLAKVSLDFAAASGKSYAETLASFSQAVLVGQARGLREFGISAKDATRYTDEYAHSLGKTSNELTEAEQRQAVLNLIMEKAKTVAGAKAEVDKTAYGQMQLLTLEAKKQAEEIGGDYTSSLGLAVQGLRSLLEVMKELRGSQIDVSKSFIQMGTDFKTWVDDVDRAIPLLGKLDRAAYSAWNNITNWFKGGGVKAGEEMSTSPGYGPKTQPTPVTPAKPEDTKKQAVEVSESLDQIVAKMNLLRITSKDLQEEDLKTALAKEKKMAEISGESTQEQIKDLRELAKQHKLTHEQMVAVAYQLGQVELQQYKETMQKIRNFGKEIGGALATTVEGLTGAFGKSFADIGKAWEDLLKKMLEELVKAGIMQIVNDIFNPKKGGKGGGGGGALGDAAAGAAIAGPAGAAVGGLLGLLGFDNPANDAKAYAAGGKWFADALRNFSQGYVNKATDAASAPGMAAAMGGDTHYHVSAVFPSRYSMMTPSAGRRLAKDAGNLLKRHLGAV